MENLVRREVVETAKTLVVKIGTNVLSQEDGSLDVVRLRSLAEQIHRVHESGRRVVIVSSGAVGAGMSLLSLKERPRDLPHLQAAAATGQAHLIRLYDDCLRPHGYHAAQMSVDGQRFQNPCAVSQRPQHAAYSVRIRGRADHQRKRHRERGGDEIRRQRPTGGDGRRICCPIRC